MDAVPLPPIGEIAARAGLIRLDNRRWALDAGLDENTIGRAINGDTDPLSSTHKAMYRALVAEEIRLRDYLLRVQPLATIVHRIAIPEAELARHADDGGCAHD